MQKLYWDAITINGQKVFYTVTENGLNFVSSPGQGVSQVLSFYKKQSFEFVYDHRKTISYRKEFKRFLKGKRERFIFSTDYFVDGTPQQEEVWQKIDEIPYGETVSVTELAKQLKMSVLEIEDAMKACPIWLAVPLHRVLGIPDDSNNRIDSECCEYLRGVEQKHGLGAD